MTTLETLNEIFRAVFDDGIIQIRPEFTADDVPGWDSLSHINLILAVEARFKLRFTQKELLTLRNIGDLHKTIEEKLKTGK
jgi:acyl carrier protein